MRKSLYLITGAALLGLAVAGTTAMAAGKGKGNGNGPKDEFNLSLGGFELVTESGNASRQDIRARGTIAADPSGDLANGTISMSVTNPEPADGTTATSACTGTATGTISAGSNQIYTISLAYTDSVDSGQCLSQTFALTCVRALSAPGLLPKLDIGGYSCMVSGVSGVDAASTSIDAASMSAHFAPQIATGVPHQ